MKNPIKTPSTVSSLYIHTPWCIHKCPYCDFNSHTLKTTLPESDYIDALIDDFRSKQSLTNFSPIQTIFIGGGTPSLLSPNAYDTLFTALRQEVDFEKDCEITIEANPGTVDQAFFEGYRELGINRLSLGVQSFQTNQLKSLQRIHSGDDALNAIAIAKSAGFSNFNVDLMFGLPDQTINAAMDDLKMAIDQAPNHLSWYQLTLEPNTRFFHSPPTLPNEDLIHDIYLNGLEILAGHGLIQYEISAYAKEQQQCQHNLNYWRFGHYIGIGAGAHSKYIDIHTHKPTRSWNKKHPKHYLKDRHSPIDSTAEIKDSEIALEFFMNTFRLKEPISFESFKQHTGLAIDEISTELRLAENQGFISIANHTIQKTSKGELFLNDLLEIFT